MSDLRQQLEEIRLRARARTSFGERRALGIESELDDDEVLPDLIMYLGFEAEALWEAIFKLAEVIDR